MERRDENQLDENLGKEPGGADDVNNPDLEEDDEEGETGGDDAQSADDVGTARESA